MSREIVINVEEKEKRAAILESGRLTDFFIEHPEDKTIVGNIYKGVVGDIVPSVGAAFIDIGEKKKGFLYLTDVSDFDYSSDDVGPNAKKHRATHRLQLKKNQDILVQVTKEPFASKGARLTTHISLPGRYLVLMPFDRHFGISRKVDDPKERRRIRDIIREIDPGNGFGLIVRTVAWGQEKKALQRDLHFLLHLWEKIKKASQKSRPPNLLYEDYDLLLRIVREHFTDETDKLIVDSKIEYKRIYKFVSAFLRPLVKKIVFYREHPSLFDKKGVEKEIERLYAKKVYLPCGGYIVIEQTEGLTVVDVNSGGFSRKRLRQEEAAFMINTQAAKEIARQLRLRDLSGIIVIDFIDMQQESNRRRLLRLLKVGLSEDKAKTDVVGISRLGVVEMTRERVHRSLESISYKDCPYCQGKGRVKSEASMVGYVFRHLRNSLGAVRARVVHVTLQADVAAKILQENRYSLRMLERKFHKRINIVADKHLHIEDIKVS